MRNVYAGRDGYHKTCNNTKAIIEIAEGPDGRIRMFNIKGGLPSESLSLYTTSSIL